MEVVTLDGYTEDEKVAIARNHLLPRQLERAALSEDEVTITDEALRLIAGEYTREAGVRQLERALAKVLRKVATRLASTDDTVGRGRRRQPARVPRPAAVPAGVGRAHGGARASRPGSR